MTPRQLTLHARNKEILRFFKKVKNKSEVARKYNLSRERVRQIIARSLSTPSR